MAKSQRKIITDADEDVGKESRYSTLMVQTGATITEISVEAP